MKRYLLKIVSLGALLMLACAGVFAQQVNFRAAAPSVVAVGEMFNVKFSVDAKGQNFVEPDLGAFNVVAGPTMSTNYSFVMTGSDVERKEETSYSYVVQVGAAGKYTVPAAKITVRGNEYSTAPVEVEAIVEGGQAGTQAQRQTAQDSQQPTTTIADDDLLLRAVVDKSEVFKGEPVRLTLKFYRRDNVRVAGSVDEKEPAFNGFWTQSLDGSRGRVDRETYNSKIYETQVLAEYLLYPQQSGALQIDPYEMTVIMHEVSQSRRQSLLDDFFGGGPQIREVRKRIATAPVRVNVKELPSGAPEGFNGAVGNFTMSTELPPETIVANSSVTMSVRINGTGNLPMIQAPTISIPASFEQYNIKTTESLSNSARGISGYRQFEYPLIARAEGEFVIEPVRFAFFDPSSGHYVSLSSKELQLSVLPDSSSVTTGTWGMVSGISKEDLRILGEDIRFIKTGSPKLISKGNMVIGSLGYYMLLLALAALFVVALIMLQKRIREMSNVEVVKGKRANKVALQRLREAQRYMNEGNERKFYEEMLRALWGYMSDKLNIPVAILTKDNVRDTLLRKRVGADYVNRYIDIISECELAQYSPSDSGQMQDIYRGALATISKLESVIRR